MASAPLDSRQKEIKRLLRVAGDSCPKEYTNAEAGSVPLDLHQDKRLPPSYRLDENGKLCIVSKRQLFGG